MKRNRISIIIIILLLVFLPLSTSCNRKAAAVRKAIRKQEKTERKQRKAYEKAYKEFRSRQYEIQAPEVRERMDRHREEAEQRALQNKRRVPFWKRWFSKKYRKHRKYKRYRKL
jgi:hypothetical protein